MNKDMKLSEHLASPSEAALSHLSELNGLRLSPHFTLGELTKTSIKTEDGNIPSRVAIENLRNLCENWLEDLRYSYNTLYHKGGIVINSGYRSPEVNKRVGGAATSNHVTGCAVDIHVTGFEQAIRYASILLDISDGTQRDYDELFIEKNSSGNHHREEQLRQPLDPLRRSSERQPTQVRVPEGLNNHSLRSFERGDLK